MRERAREHVLDAAGPGAPPRKNGELVFAAPWESRAFGLTMALHERGLFAWEEFRERLIGEIARWERHPPIGVAWSYYERWLTALEALLAEKGVCLPAEVAARAQALHARPPGHDH